MSSINNSRLQTVLSVLLSLVIATGLWYLVVGRDHVETQVELRVEYRGLPEGLIIREGMVNHISVRLRGSAELLRNLHSRDLVYTVDLSGVQRGATALPLAVDSMPDFKAFEILEIMPSRLVLEADALTERVVPLENKMLPLPADSPYLISHAILEPSFVTVKGPETQVNSLDRLIVVYDPTKNASEGPHEANVAIVAPPQVEITPPVTTLRYSLDLKTKEVSLTRDIQLDNEDEGYSVRPDSAKVEISVPEALVEDRDYLDAVRVIVRQPSDFMPGDSAEVTPIVMLPSGSGLISIDPPTVMLYSRTDIDPENRAWAPAESIFSLPSSNFGMKLPDQRVSGNFSLSDINVPAASLPQPNDLKVPTALSGDEQKDSAPARSAAPAAATAQNDAVRPSSAAASAGAKSASSAVKEAPSSSETAPQETQD
ncbi:CdaR family protein [uncultured Mailhella sp.]|uniref:CdaR family protein n=1 Tax=uncultured Mailhella sp. TaxID=1981031 RepID=UPI0025EF3032|nr:CdaR family protein [uncultured Mailhella sp.]